MLGTFDIDKEMRTLRVSDVDPDKVSEDILYELFSQFGVVTDIQWQTVLRDTAKSAAAAANRRSANSFSTTTNAGGIPALLNDRIKDESVFVEFQTSADAKYAYDVLKDCRIQLYNKEMKVSYKALSAIEKLAAGGAIDVHSIERQGNFTGLFEIGAKLYISNFNRSITAAELTEFFSQFGPFAAPIRVITDKDGLSKGACVVSYKSFESSDRALDEMDGQIFKDRILKIEYADVGDGSGLKHGSIEERERALKFKEQESAHNANVQSSKEAAAAQLKKSSNVPAWAQAVQPATQGASIYRRV